MTRIKLPTGTFDYDSNQPLGRPGGAGQVFLGKASTGEVVAVKKLHVSARNAGHRELQIAVELRGLAFDHVIPFIDAGEDAESGDYFVVMPKADGSLQELINKGDVRTSTDTASILLQVIRGLLEVKDLVHRDLKPDNILFHQGKWKVADFDIARFLEAATSSNTRKERGSPEYAAPEQWRLQRATHATDVYALGCVGFCLVTGKPPFTVNPQEEHQVAPAPDFTCEDSRLRALIRHMLRKPPESRPSLSRVEGVLAEIVKNPFSSSNPQAFSALASADARIADQEQRVEAQLEAAKLARGERKRLVTTAFEILSENAERLWGQIHSQALAARRTSGSGNGVFEVHLGGAILNINLAGYGNAVEPGVFIHSGWDVVAMSTASVIQAQPHYQWSASLWYAKIEGRTEYRWYEVGYRANMVQWGRFEPFAAEVQDADFAASRIMHSVARCYGPALIDDENEDDFHFRWSGLLALASTGELAFPLSAPLRGWPPKQ